MHTKFVIHLLLLKVSFNYSDQIQKQKEYYDLVLNELERINIILGEFLVLAKPSVVVFKEIDVKKLIKDVVTLINSQLMLNNVQIKVEMDEHIPSISCEETQMKQVFINILKNSIEAMPNGGIIEIKVQEKKKGKLSICIIDQGTGIPSDRISTLGEPFYTTKEKGTGLGLMTCIRIIESHNGTFHISSELNKGTTVEITIPTITQPYIPIMIQLGDTSK
ncbi:ATP-binding protein [Heyndrickxia sporothermodurans]|uniref:ATP-binding protein n=1 Tax=Heyndrickxia sporothermodurans TaxID=46224 RepID=UPI003D211234